MIYVILGQTASGKTTLASEICHKYNMPLIGADAFQLYRELGIGVAKPSTQELEGLTHHMIDDVSIYDEMNVKVYQEKVRALLDYYQSIGQDVVMSGGTFLYVRATLFPYVFNDIEDEKDYSNYSDDKLYEMLNEKDPDTAITLHKNNRRRVEQALRMVDSGIKKSDVIMKEVVPLYPVRFFGIEVDSKSGNEAIDKRVDKMIELGLMDEVKSLMEKHDASLRAFQAIGYKEVISGLKEESSVTEIADEIKLNTRHYAKRQRTFLRHQFPNIIITTPSEIKRLIEIDQVIKSRTINVLGKKTFTNIEKAKVALVGIGGVGGIVFEGLIRLGVKSIQVIDMDTVELSNLNRQLLFTLADVGKDKVECAKNYARNINPLVEVKATKIKVESNLDSYLNGYDYIIDCIDDTKGKVALVQYALKNDIPLVVSTGSGLRFDASKVCRGTLKDVGEPLAKKMKRELSTLSIPYENIRCVYSKESRNKRTTLEIGSTFAVPNAFGLSLVSEFIDHYRVKEENEDGTKEN